MRRLAWLIPLFAGAGVRRCGVSASDPGDRRRDDGARGLGPAPAAEAPHRRPGPGRDLRSARRSSGPRPTSSASTPSSSPRTAQGNVRGAYRFSESVDGVTTHYAGALTCVEVYDFNGLTGNRAKIGGRVDSSDDPSIPVGTFIWWQAIDNSRLHRADQSTLTGFGDEAANDAFCASPNPPRFGPFDVIRGAITVLPGRLDRLALPDARRASHDAAERAGEVALVGKSRGQRHLRGDRASLAELFLRPGDPELADVPGDGHSVVRAKDPRHVDRMSTHLRRRGSAWRDAR